METEYPLEPDGQEMRELGRAALELAADFLGSIADRRDDVDGADELAANLRGPAPERGAPMNDVLDVVRLGAHKSYNSSGPGMFGYVPGSGLYSSAIASFLAAVTNKYVTLSSAAPMYAQIETTAVPGPRQSQLAGR